MQIKDCFGVEARVGDTVAFSQGSSGAKAWEFSTITKITAKCVYFGGKAAGMFRDRDDETNLRRGEGCFVINTGDRK